MKKVKLPRMKRHVAISDKFKDQGVIYFFANETFVAQVSDFGTVEFWSQENKYKLYVDARYDFDDVVEWLESLA